MSGATDIDDVIADFSGRGPSVDGKINPDVSAPGVDVVSAVPGGGYEAFSGTSMAAPHAAGDDRADAVQRTRDDRPNRRDARHRAHAPPSTIVDQSCGGDPDGDPNNVYGDGRIDAEAAVLVSATGGTLTGTVTDADGGAPIAGAEITATSDTFTSTGIGATDGTFTMLLPEGTYTVLANAFGYGPRPFPASSSCKTRRPLSTSHWKRSLDSRCQGR